MVKSDAIDVVFSFDDTGSMAPCRAQVRRVIKEVAAQLFKDINGLRIGIMIHGDYCDPGPPVVALNLTNNQADIDRFINASRSFSGGDSPECYEQVMHDARALSWRATENKVFVLIGDDVPHGPTYSLNKQKLDWRNEMGLLQNMGVSIYAVQALGNVYAEAFYKEIAEKTGGFHLRLEQFSQLVNLVKAICYQQAGQLHSFEASLPPQQPPSFTRMMDTLAKRKSVIKKSSKKDLDALPLWRYQILDVVENTRIDEFVRSQGLPFQLGNGYYEFTKREKIQESKEVILQDKRTEEFYCGKKVRELLGLPSVGDVNMSPAKDSPYRFFVQSKAPNRKLIAGTSFLYQVDTTR